MLGLVTIAFRRTLTFVRLSVITFAHFFPSATMKWQVLWNENRWNEYDWWIGWQSKSWKRMQLFAVVTCLCSHSHASSLALPWPSIRRSLLETLVAGTLWQGKDTNHCCNEIRMARAMFSVHIPCNVLDNTCSIRHAHSMSLISFHPTESCHSCHSAQKAHIRYKYFFFLLIRPEEKKKHYESYSLPFVRYFCSAYSGMHVNLMLLHKNVPMDATMRVRNESRTDEKYTKDKSETFFLLAKLFLWCFFAFQHSDARCSCILCDLATVDICCGWIIYAFSSTYLSHGRSWSNPVHASLHESAHLMWRAVPWSSMQLCCTGEWMHV